MLRLCLTLAAALAVTLAAPAAGQGAAVPGGPLVDPSGIGAQSAPREGQAATPLDEVPAEKPAAQEPSSRAAQDEGDEGSVEDGGLTEDGAAPEGTAAQAGDEAAPEAMAAQAGDRDCGDFDSQQEAQDFFDENGGSPDNNVDRLDADGDGEACEDFSFSADDADDADDGDDEPAPRGGIDTGLGGTAGERGRSVPGLMGLCLLAVSGALAVGRRRRQPRPTAR